MSDYVRPAIAQQEFVDASGQVIPYGERWGRESPPENSYSIETHPERFEPLHTVADALIAYLGRHYAVHVSEDLAFSADLVNPPGNAIRAVRLTPQPVALIEGSMAAITFVFTSYPSVIIHAGLIHDFAFPTCGCDACDESFEIQAALLESHTLAVVEGRYREWITGGLLPRIDFSIAFADGYQSGSSHVPQALAARARQAKKVLARVPAEWAAWPQVETF
jgi:hypothetical protein